MESIFSNKQLIDQEYKKLFLDKLSSFKKLKECIKARYDKNEITDETLKNILTNNHKIIYDFIGASNENRLRHFFGDFNQIDLRDRQIKFVDRFILDSIHFDVISTLMIQLQQEYERNQQKIDATWEREIQSYPDFELLPKICIIQNLLKLIRPRIFNDLVFPENKSVQLFKQGKNSLLPNRSVFINWLPKPQLKSKTDLTSLLSALAVAIVTAGAMGSAFIFGSSSSSALIGATLGSLAGPPGIIIGLLLCAAIAGLVYGVTRYFDVKDSAANIKTQDNETIRSCSHELMNGRMPAGMKPEPLMDKNIYIKLETEDSSCKNSIEANDLIPQNRI